MKPQYCNTIASSLRPLRATLKKHRNIYHCCIISESFTQSSAIVLFILFFGVNGIIFYTTRYLYFCVRVCFLREAYVPERCRAYVHASCLSMMHVVCSSLNDALSKRSCASDEGDANTHFSSGIHMKNTPNFNNQQDSKNGLYSCAEFLIPNKIIDRVPILYTPRKKK